MGALMIAAPRRGGRRRGRIDRRPLPRADERHRTGGDARLARVGAAREDDRHACADDDSRADRAAQVHELLREHVAALEIGDHQDVGRAGDVGHDALGARSGGRHGVVESERSVEDGAFDLAAVGHLAQRRGIERGGHVRIDGLDRREDGNARAREAERVREVDRVAYDVRLVGERRRDVERGVGDDERPRIRRRLHQEAVAHATPGAQRARNHGTHQLVGVQAALHQRVDLAVERELHGARGGRVAVRHVLDREVVDLQLGLLRHRQKTRTRPDEHRLDQARGAGVERGGQAHASHG